MTEELKKCSCGEPWTKRVIHRTDAPCYWPPRETPTPQGTTERVKEVCRIIGIEDGIPALITMVEQEKALSYQRGQDDLREEILKMVDEKMNYYREASQKDLDEDRVMLAYDMDSRYVAMKHFKSRLLALSLLKAKESNQK